MLNDFQNHKLASDPNKTTLWSCPWKPGVHRRISTCIVKIHKHLFNTYLGREEDLLDWKLYFIKERKRKEGRERGRRRRESREGKKGGKELKQKAAISWRCPCPRLMCAHIPETAEGLTYCYTSWLMEPGCTHKGDAVESPVETVSEAST